MTTLNRCAGEAMREFKAHAATDVTGFSLLGHLAEMAAGSKKTIEIDFAEIPLFSAVERLAREDAFPGAVERNREASDEFIDYGELTQAEQNILYSPETSGGLLVALPREQTSSYIQYLQKHGIEAVTIGLVAADSEQGLIRLHGSKGIESKPRKFPTVVKEQHTTDCCCNKAAETVNNTSSCCCQTTAEKKPPENSTCCSAADTAPAVTVTSSLPSAAAGAEFTTYMKTVNNPGAINAKEKKLIALALSVSHKCAECIRQNSAAAAKLGANPAEIAEAVALGISFGGASANMFYNELQQ